VAGALWVGREFQQPPGTWTAPLMCASHPTGSRTSGRTCARPERRFDAHGCYRSTASDGSSREVSARCLDARVSPSWWVWTLAVLAGMAGLGLQRLGDYAARQPDSVCPRGSHYYQSPIAEPGDSGFQASFIGCRDVRTHVDLPYTALSPNPAILSPQNATHLQEVAGTLVLLGAFAALIGPFSRRWWQDWGGGQDLTRIERGVVRFDHSTVTAAGLTRGAQAMAQIVQARGLTCPICGEGFMLGQQLEVDPSSGQAGSGRVIHRWCIDRACAPIRMTGPPGLGVSSDKRDAARIRHPQSVKSEEGESERPVL